MLGGRIIASEWKLQKGGFWLKTSNRLNFVLTYVPGKIRFVRVPPKSHQLQTDTQPHHPTSHLKMGGRPSVEKITAVSSWDVGTTLLLTQQEPCAKNWENRQDYQIFSLVWATFPPLIFLKWSFVLFLLKGRIFPVFLTHSISLFFFN